jgi:ribonucleotide reductase beta subunit family protein with ferritin-like domain
VANYKDVNTPAWATTAFLAVMAQLTVFDIERGMDAAETFLKIVEPAEIKAALTRMVFEEMGHTESYRYIIENFGLPVTGPDNFYDTWKKVPAMRKRVEKAQSVSDSLMRAYENKEIDENAFVTEFLRATFFWFFIFEGIQFWLNLLGPIQALSDLKYYEKAAEQFRYIARDECIAEGTEVLTPNGWLPVEKVAMETSLAQWHSDNTISWTTPVALSTHVAESYIEFEIPKPGFRQRVSDNHRMVYWTSHGNLKVIQAKLATPNTLSKHPVAAPLRELETEAGLTTLERFQIALQADGSLSDRYDGSRCGTVPARFSFSKRRKIERLERILSELGWNYVASVRVADGERKEQIKFIVDIPLSANPTKKITDVFSLNGKSLRWCREFIEEVAEWDGHRVAENLSRIHYSSKDKSNSDFIQAAATLAGYRTRLTVQEDLRSNTFSSMNRVHISKHENSVKGGRMLKTRKDGPIQMYGIEVPSSFLVIRDGGGVSITGNSQHIALGVDLWKWVIAQYPSAVTENLIDTIHTDIRESVDSEKEFISYVMRDGAFVGYDATRHGETAEWLANHRLKVCGLPTVYENPTHHFRELFSRKMETMAETNFFEQHVKEYKTGSGLSWDEEEDEGHWPGDFLGNMQSQGWSEEK